MIPKLEGRITVPTGGYTVTVTEPAASAAVTFAAGDYYLTTSTSLLSSLASSLTNDATLSGTYTLTLDDTNSTSTGKVTLAVTGVASATFVFAESAFKNLLGWNSATTMAGAASYVSDNQAQYLWLPTVGRANPMAPEPTTATDNFGARESDFTFALAQSGASKALSYSSALYIDTFEWIYEVGSKMWKVLEVTGNESLERFWEQVLSQGYPFRYHRDRSDDSVYATLKVVDAAEYKPKPVSPSWTSASSLWSVAYTMRPNR